MKKMTTGFLSILLLAVVISACTQADQQSASPLSENSETEGLEFANPIIKQRADPWVYKHTDGYYYFTGSVPEYDRIELRRAKTIQGLGDAETVVVWEKHDSGPMSQHIWAPELHYIDHKWYIYFAAGEKDDIWKIRPYVLETAAENPLEGNWVEKGMMQAENPLSEAFTDFSLDATTFEHNGQRYTVWAEKRTGVSNLYIDELINPWTIAGNEVLIATPKHPWEKIGFWVNEGAAMIKRNGKIFITFSASATDANYNIGLLSALETSDLLDPQSWSKAEAPLLRSNEETNQYGPGHNSFTVSPDGKTDILIYHARNYEDIEGDPLYDPNRHTRAQVFSWNEDGTPNFGVPIPDANVEADE